MRQITIFIFFFLTVLTAYSQNYFKATIHSVTNKTVKQCFNKVEYSATVYQVLILPCTDSKGNVTDQSNYISQCLATELNSKLANSKQKFNVISYTDLNNSVKDSLLAMSQVSEYKQSLDYKKTIEYFTKLSEVKNKHFFVTLNYTLENNLYNIQNLRLDYNYKIMDVPQGKSFTISNVSTKTVINQRAMVKSFVPGLGQFYKNNKIKGILFVSAVPLLIGGGMYFNIMQQKYLNRWISTGSQTSYNSYKNMQNFEKYMFVIGGTIYITNLFDAYFTTPK